MRTSLSTAILRTLLPVSWVLVGACTTAPPAPTPRGGERTEVPVESGGGEVSIDYMGLQRALGMDISADKLGYREKAFETCQTGYGYSPTKNCRREFMVVINFQLQCRDSEGTVAEGLTSADLTAIARRPVKWSLKGIQGTTETDSDGFAQIMTVMSKSPKKERLKLSVGNEFLYMRANEITQVVTPRPWCSQ